MATNTSDHAPAYTQRSPGRWRWRTMAFVPLVLILALVSPAITISRVESQMDAVTGSVCLKTVWILGIASSPQVNPSPLEIRLRRSGIQWTPTWQLVHKTHRNIFGGSTKYECASGPPIYELEPVLDKFTAVSSDAELKEFVQTMQSSSISQQRAAVDAATDTGMRASFVIRRGG